MRFLDQLKQGLNVRSSQPSEAALMPSVKACASTILHAFGDAQAQLVGKAVVLTDGKAGTVEEIWLDEGHGLRISIKGHDGKWPVSTIKFAEDMGPTQLN
jgi:hypothetical protein